MSESLSEKRAFVSSGSDQVIISSCEASEAASTCALAFDSNENTKWDVNWDAVGSWIKVISPFTHILLAWKSQRCSSKTFVIGVCFVHFYAVSDLYVSASLQWGIFGGQSGHSTQKIHFKWQAK